MLKSFLLAALLLMLGNSASYADDVTQQNAHPEFIKASFNPNTPEPSTLEEFASNIAVYSLIIGVYAIYWFKQKA